MNLKKKLILAILVVNVILVFGYVKSFAASLSDMESQASDFLSVGESNAGVNNSVVSAITDNFSSLGSILTFLGAGVMVIAVSVMGIKYMTASPDKQAVLKQQLIGLVVAGIVIFGAYGIWKTLVNILSAID